MTTPRIAIVCDFLTTFGGAERVVMAMHEAFPEAPIYTAIYNADKLPEFRNLDIRTSRLQRLPAKLRKFYKLFPTMAVNAMRNLNLNEFDIILTSSYLHGHQVTKTRPNQVVINYCHTPPRYYWSHYDEYRRNPGYGKLDPFVRALMPLMVPKQRKLDLEAAKNVDVFIANATVTQERIKQYYGRSSTIIFPPVLTDRFLPERTRGDYYVTSGRQLPYKRYDLIVEACSKLGRKLVVVGNGPAHDQLVRLAGPTVEFRTDRFTDASDTELERLLNSARGYIFAAEEDFGITQVEALAAGAPVIGLARTGTLDIVEDGVSGVLFAEQTVDAIASAIKHFETLDILPATTRRKAKRFDQSLFITKLRKIVSDNS